MKAIFTILILASAITTAWSQTIVTGTVSDKNNQPISGVTVGEKGTNNGTFTDVKGNYTIKVTGDAVLVFSSVGYAWLEQRANGQTQVNVHLEDATTELTGVQVIGSRSLNRSITNTPVPVDYIDLKKVANDQGQIALNQLLQYLAPSFNATRQSGSDAADHIDPATLRGLGPDQTLVLINGKRLHQTSLINIYGTRGRGNTGTDLDAIPVSAIDHIEILRDGASAQYGSDAIAGVINIVLKNTTGEFSGNINGGANIAQYDYSNNAFDGGTIQVGGNYGLPIGSKGYINISADYLGRDHTNRANDPWYPDHHDVRTHFGEAQADNTGVFFNAMAPISDHAQFYAFGGYNYRFTNSYQFNRSADDPRNVIDIFPNGFSPILQSVITDKDFTVGVRGDLSRWNIDFSNTIGSNKFHYYGDSTVNASLVDNTPLFFDDGGHQVLQNTTNLDFTRYYNTVLSGLDIAFGFENRLENYQIFQGQEESYKTYGPVIFSIDSAFNDQNQFIGFDTSYRPGGAQGFPGYQPTNVVNANRSSQAGYVDVEADITKEFLIDAAVRAEHYSDFGNTLAGKLAMRYAISSNFAVRGSISNGFRAPSLAQIYYNNTFTNVESGKIFDEIIASNVSPLARALGIPALKPEKAITASLGFTTTPLNGFSATVDGYWVQVKNRIVLTGIFDESVPAAAPFLQAQNVTGAQFFTNAVNTHNIGLDVIINYSTYVGNNRLNLSYIANFNQLTIDKIYTNPTLEGYEDLYFGPREQQFVKFSAPPSKMTLSGMYGVNKFTGTLNVNRWGKIDFVDYDGNPYSMKAKFTVDLNLGYNISRNVSLNIGATNLFNTYPDHYDPYETESGGAFESVQMGFDGTFIYGKLGFRF